MQNSQNPQCKMKDRKTMILAIIAFCIIAFSLPCYVILRSLQKQDVHNPEPEAEPVKVMTTDSVWEEDMEAKAFTFMYDVDGDHPWSSYISTDSNYVLRLEKLYGDSLGSSYRAIIYEPEYWYNGMTHFPKFGEEPTYVGYGTDYYAGHKDCYLKFSFIRGNVDSNGDAYAFVLSGSYRDLDSVLISNPVPTPGLSDEDDYKITFKKRKWEDIRECWDRKQPR